VDDGDISQASFGRNLRFTRAHLPHFIITALTLSGSSTLQRDFILHSTDHSPTRSSSTAGT
jgi:hypothetical protein